MIDQFLHFI